MEKVCVRAGPEFGPSEGHLLVIEKALCRLRTSGARFYAKFADTLHTLGFMGDIVLENTDTFTYLGRVISADDDNWPAVAGKPSKARKQWGQFSMILH